MILCAAVKFHIDKTNKDVILPCLRHGDAFKCLKDFGFEPHKGYKELEQGFITTTGEFLNREDALKMAISSGQLSITTQQHIRCNMLFSEDLY